MNIPCFCIVCVLLSPVLCTAEKKPNVVFILADDLGWSDTTIYGTTTFYETPHLESLAQMGMRLSQAYTPSPVCSPTRAGIMTGKWPVRFGITQARCHEKEVRLKAAPVKEESPNRKTLELRSATRLPTEGVLTMAKHLKANGYLTAHFGKWHLGFEPHSALEHGFDFDIPHTGDGFGKTYIAPWTNPDLDELHKENGEHIEDALAAGAAEFICEHANDEKPVFLNYWAFSVHSPWSAREDYAKEFLEKRDPMNPQSNPVYAAMVKSFDDSVGTIVQALKDAGIMENTILIFSSDNGGNKFAPPRAEPGFGKHMAGTNNFPLRNGKGSLYEGGVRVPMVVVWPGKVAKQSSSDEQFNLVDLFPTLNEMLELELTEAMDGVSQWEIFKGGESQREYHFYYYPHYSDGGTEPSAAIREGDWKLIRFYYGKLDQSHRIELYNLSWNIHESQNIASRFPEITKRLTEKLDAYLKDTNAPVPLRNPLYPTQPITKLMWR